jgi:hypothetical protein
MSDARIPRLAYGLLLGTGVLDWVRRYPLLPSRMASHIGPQGEVNNWRSIEHGGCGMVCLRAAVFATVRSVRGHQCKHAVARTVCYWGNVCGAAWACSFHGSLDSNVDAALQARFSVAGGPAAGRGKTGKERQSHNLLLLLNVMGSSLEVFSYKF